MEFLRDTPAAAKTMGLGLALTMNPRLAAQLRLIAGILCRNLFLQTFAQYSWTDLSERCEDQLIVEKMAEEVCPRATI